MDNYPEHLAPEFEEGGAVATPFPEWWARVREHFPTVPENVAEQWLHRHWEHSPFAFLRSPFYRFDLVTLPTAELDRVQIWHAEPSGDHSEEIEQGRVIVEEVHRNWGYWLAEQMIRTGQFPEPIIILDNDDGHVTPGREGYPLWAELPKGWILIEGHRRIDIAFYLRTKGMMAPVLKAWFMRRQLNLPI